MKNEKINGPENSSKNQVKNQSRPEGPVQTPAAPTAPEVREWAKKDVKSAIAFLSLLESTPGLMDKVVSEIMDWANRPANNG